MTGFNIVFFEEFEVLDAFGPTLAFLGDRHGQAAAQESANRLEYRWNADKDFDPFAV